MVSFTARGKHLGGGRKDTELSALKGKTALHKCRIRRLQGAIRRQLDRCALHKGACRHNDLVLIARHCPGLVGAYAENVINNLHADLAFFSAQSVEKNGEVYDCFEEENVLRKRMMAQSAKRVLLCDGTKLNRTSLFKLCHISDVDYIVSEKDVRTYFTTPSVPKVLFD